MQIRRRTGRVPAATVLIAGLIALLSACSGSTQTPPGETSITTVPTTFADVGIAEPARQVGRSCLAPSNPDGPGPDPARIAVTDVTLLDALCALGEQTKVVAVAATPAQIPGYLGPSVTSLPALGDSPDPAAAQATRPDVVLTTDASSPTTKAFGTTRVVQIGKTQDWRAQFTAVGTALGRSGAAATRLDDLDEYAREAGARSDAWHTQVSLVRVTATQTQIPGTASFAGQILTLMGAQRPAPQRGDNTIDLTGKSLTAADGDIIYVSFTEDAIARDRAESLLKSDAWHGLQAPTWRRVFISDDRVWYRSPGVIAARWVVADVQRTINGAS